MADITRAVETIPVPAIPYVDAPVTLLIATIMPEIDLTQQVTTLSTGDIFVAYGEADIVAQFVIQAVPTSRTTMYTVPVLRNAIIRWMDLVNTTGSPITVDVWLGGVKWENARSVAANDKYARDTITELGPGAFIEMQASGAGVNAFMAGVLEQAT
jgi:hypothetical protein